MDTSYEACPTCSPVSAPAVSSVRGKGLAYLGLAGAIFVVCSMVQAMGGSSMFSTSFPDPGNLLFELLMQVTFWPGWALTGYFAFRGVVMLVADKSWD